MYTFGYENINDNEEDPIYMCTFGCPEWNVAFAYDKLVCNFELSDDHAMVEVVQSNGPETVFTATVKGSKLTINYTGDPATLTVQYNLDKLDLQSFRDCVVEMQKLTTKN